MKKLKHLLVLARPKKKVEQKTATGIIIPETIREKSRERYAEVILTGTSDKDFNMEVKPGDNIIYLHQPNHIIVENEVQEENETITYEDVLIHINDILVVL